MEMDPKSAKLLDSLRRYYTVKYRFDQIYNIVNSAHDPTGSSVSLRLVDWLITNYAKVHNIVYYVKNTPFNIHQSYKCMLKAYSKRLFDPFRRHARVTLELNGLKLETTVAQLCFFRWAIDNDVLKYAHTHKDVIKHNMDSSTSAGPKGSPSHKGPTTHQQQPRGPKPPRPVKRRGTNKYTVDIRVSFT